MVTVLRVVILYACILLFLRILGKREFGQLTPMELVSLLLIPEMVSQAIIGQDFSLTNAILAVATLLSLVFVTSALVHVSKRADNVVSGEPAVLVAHGQVMYDALNRERVSPDELFAEMHKAGVDRLEAVRWALLETDGKIAIVPEQPVPGAVRTPSRGPV